MKIKIEVDVQGVKPEDATHYIPETVEFFECWVKDGYSMQVKTQNEWVADDATDPSTKYAYKIV